MNLDSLEFVAVADIVFASCVIIGWLIGQHEKFVDFHHHIFQQCHEKSWLAVPSQ